MCMLRGMIKKRESCALKGIEVAHEGSTGDGSEATFISLVWPHFINHVCNTEGKAINCVSLTSQAFNKLLLRAGWCLETPEIA